MATSRDYLNFVLEQLSDIDGITHRRMMGEYIIYHHGVAAAETGDSPPDSCIYMGSRPAASYQ